jgi:hypothetical protein
MKRSEKLLALGLMICLLAFVVKPWNWIYGPIAEQQVAKEKADDKLKETGDQLAIARASVRSMSEFKERSLSSNSAQGALAYQQWLTDLAEIVAELSGAEVTPDPFSASRDKSYVGIRMRVTGEGSMEQLRTFLYRFHRANVLHRISSMTVESLNNSSSPKLKIRITAEAISLRDAPAKGPTLFPRTRVVAINSDDVPTRLEVESVEGFPTAAPFELRIGQNYYIVADVIDNELLLELDEDQAVAAAADDIVELSVVHSDFSSVAITEYDALIEKNPFAKPAPKSLQLIGEKKVGRGLKISLEAKVTGISSVAAAEDVVFEFLELADGMTADAGKLEWEPPAELAAGDFTVKVRATGGGLTDPLEQQVKLTLFEENKPPVITIPDNLVATLGQAITTKLTATDPETPAEELKFALADGAPEGTVFNAETGELTFTPAAEGEPRDVTINVTVTDAGTPAQTAKAEIKVTVQDDKAQFTFMEGIVDEDDVRQAWLRDKSTNTRMVLREGDDLKYAGIDAVVLSIGNDFLLMQQADETHRMNVGQNLRETIVIARLDPPKDSAADKDATDEDAARPAAPPQPEDSESEAPAGDTPKSAVTKKTVGEVKTVPSTTVEVRPAETTPVAASKPTAPKPTAPKPTAPKPTAPKPTAPKPTVPKPATAKVPTTEPTTTGSAAAAPAKAATPAPAEAAPAKDAVPAKDVTPAAEADKDAAPAEGDAPAESDAPAEGDAE